MLKKLTLDDVYERACAGAGRMPEDAQYQSWKKVLVSISAQALDSALTQWQGRTDEDEFTGKAVGRLMPSPADLKAIIEADERRAVHGTKYTSCGENGCIEGLVFVKKDGTLWNALKDSMEPKYGRDCRCKIEWRQRLGKIRPNHAAEISRAVGQ